MESHRQTNRQDRQEQADVNTTKPCHEFVYRIPIMDWCCLNRTTKDQRRAETNGRGTAPIGSRCRELSRACFFSRTVASGRGFGQSWMQAEPRLEDVDHGQGMSEAELDRS
ncbi:hypothetical protein F2Q69_00048464 [Brassica cretica]|uniref:Uncharacterized protein n=1 Tax=Brassica cretica TaxID=69181 RepID=A0A8S9PVV1_BRACR|nr:hypothetical protein F2Q69_00048464 [Brassica cretica]